MHAVTDYQKLYLSLFGRISSYTEEIARTSSPTDRQAEAIFLKLCQIMQDTEEQYLTLTEEA